MTFRKAKKKISEMGLYMQSAEQTILGPNPAHARWARPGPSPVLRGPT